MFQEEAHHHKKREPQSFTTEALSPFAVSWKSVRIRQERMEVEAVLNKQREPSMSGSLRGARLLAKVSPRLVMHEQRENDDDRQWNAEQPKKCASSESHIQLLCQSVCLLTKRPSGSSEWDQQKSPASEEGRAGLYCRQVGVLCANTRADDDTEKWLRYRRSHEDAKARCPHPPQKYRTHECLLFKRKVGEPDKEIRKRALPRAAYSAAALVPLHGDFDRLITGSV